MQLWRYEVDGHGMDGFNGEITTGAPHKRFCCRVGYIDVDRSDRSRLFITLPCQLCRLFLHSQILICLEVLDHLWCLVLLASSAAGSKWPMYFWSHFSASFSPPAPPTIGTIAKFLCRRLSSSHFLRFLIFSQFKVPSLPLIGKMGLRVCNLQCRPSFAMTVPLQTQIMTSVSTI